MSAKAVQEYFLFWPLETGVRVIAYTDLALSWISFSLCVPVLYTVYFVDLTDLRHRIEETQNVTMTDEAWKNRITNIRRYMPIVAVHRAYNIYSSFYLVKGIEHQIPSYIENWVIYKSICNVMQLAISLINTIPRMGLAVVPQVISSVAYFFWFRYIIRSVHNYQLTM